jgi:hypothetical protein
MVHGIMNQLEIIFKIIVIIILFIFSFSAKTIFAVDYYIPNYM